MPRPDCYKNFDCLFSRRLRAYRFRPGGKVLEDATSGSLHRLGAGNTVLLRSVGRLRLRAGTSQRGATRHREDDDGSDAEQSTRHRITPFLKRTAHAVNKR